MPEIRLGGPEIYLLWKDLGQKSQAGTLNGNEAKLRKKWGKAMNLLGGNPRHPSLNSHEIEPLSRRYGVKVFQSYLENRTPKAGRMYWVYGPGKDEITVIGLEPHPEDQKNSGYAKVKLSGLGYEEDGQ